MGIFDAYIAENSVRRINTGKSGAQVHVLSGGRIAKYVSRDALKDDSMWEAYRREYLFYREFADGGYDFIPRIMKNEMTDGKYLLIMKEYRPVSQAEMADAGMQEKVMHVLRRIHALPVPEIFRRKERGAANFDEGTVLRCREGWLDVIKRHGDMFPEGDLDFAAENINRINAHFYDPEFSFVHGDFHRENLLADKDGGIVVCDWQNCGVGDAAGDISFLLSRLSADGLEFSRDAALEIYAQTKEEAEKLDSGMRLANLNTAFLFWHEFLRGADAQTVGNIFGSMVRDARVLISRMGA